MDNDSDNRVRTISLLIKNQMNSTSIHHIVIRLYWPRGKDMNNEEENDRMTNIEKRLENTEKLMFRVVQLMEAELKPIGTTKLDEDGNYKEVRSKLW